MRGFRAIYVPLIFILPWVGVPAGFYFGKIKPLNEEWKTTLDARNGSRGAYGSSTEYEGLWPPEGREDSPKFEAGRADQQQDEQAFQRRKAEKEAELARTTKERDEHRKLYDQVLNRYMAGINLSKFDYDKPDELLYELLRVQRDEEGPHLIKFLHKTYPDLFFIFGYEVPAPPINLTASTLPPKGQEGSLAWPVGRGALQMTVFGPYEKLLDFVETFPDKYDRITYLTGFRLERLAFDYRGSVLMRLNTTAEFFVWPKPDLAPGGGAAGGMPGGMPGMPGAMPGMPGAMPGSGPPPGMMGPGAQGSGPPPGMMGPGAGGPGGPGGPGPGGARPGGPAGGGEEGGGRRGRGGGGGDEEGGGRRGGGLGRRGAEDVE